MPSRFEPKKFRLHKKKLLSEVDLILAGKKWIDEESGQVPIQVAAELNIPQASGIGGLTVFKEISKALPSFEIIYLGDTARLPYGVKSRDLIIQYSMQIANFLIKNDAWFYWLKL